MKTMLRKEGRGASILFMSIVLMLVLLLLGSVLFKVIPAEMQAANRSHQDLNGHYVARSGIEEARAWLSVQMATFEDSQNEEDLPDYTEDNGASYDNIAAFVAEANARRPFTKGDWRYEIDIRPQQNQVSQSNNFQPRYYAVRSTSFLNDRPIRRIDVLLRQSTFASFAFYTEQFDASTAFIMNGKTQMFGPVHTNDFFRFNATALESKGWSGVDPYFADVVTHSSMDPGAPAQGDGNAWVGGAPYDAGGPIAGRYEAVFKDGRNDLRLKNAIDLPTSTDGLIGMTWPETSTLPTSAGAYVHTDASGKADGGIYVEGDALELNLRLDQFGNQATVVRQNINAGTKTTTSTNTKWKYIPFNPRKYYSCDKNPCLKWSTPSGGGGSGGGGGVGGGAASGPSPTCLQYTKGTCESLQKVADGTTTTTSTSTDWDALETTIYEVTEAPVTVQDQNGANVTAQVGDTLVVTRVRDEEANSNYVTTKVQLIQDSQINGNIFVNGNIGSEDHRAWERPQNQTGVEARGLWGISKGSAQVDASGNFVLDAHGNKTYANKAIITPLDKGVSLGGDLLQFDPDKFAALGSSVNYANKTSGAFNWTQVALNPNRVDGTGQPDPEKSPNSDHVLGVLTLDLWMKGSNTPETNSLSSWDREMMGGDRFSDIYVVALAGRSESDGTSSGGFGTRRPHRDNLVNDGLGKYRLVGGIIQGTVGRNRGDNSHGGQDTHHWVDSSGSVGYDVQMFYDKEATRQRIFPVQSAFGVVRMIETSMRDRT